MDQATSHTGAETGTRIYRHVFSPLRIRHLTLKNRIMGSAHAPAYNADADIEAARTVPDPARQLALWKEAQRKLIAEVAAVPLIETLEVWARRKNFEYGFDLIGSMSRGVLLSERSRFA